MVAAPAAERVRRPAKPLAGRLSVSENLACFPNGNAVALEIKIQLNYEKNYKTIN